ncbi:S41 family peptidase [Mangrovibacterium sp.]|uniref:S41 family peptidase n=1 Tax=Mangrovibacterium sp. TaxID=1961364 RepID=UPI0035670D1A
MKKLAYHIFCMAFCLAIWSSCSKDEETIVDTETTEESVSSETLAINQWIKENMELYYYWNTKLPDIDETKEADSFDYFDQLLYTTEDKWSWITDDYASLAAEFSGSQYVMGFDATPTWTSEAQTAICFFVNYVYPGSAAEEAGLLRGDIILKLNNQTITLDNYTDLYTDDAYSVQLADITSGALVLNGKSYSLVAKQTTTDPSIYHTVLDVDGKSVGYLVYVEFVAGDDDKFLTTLDNIFTEFKTSGVTDLVVDFRYNPGGEIDAATYLAAAIAPASVVSAGSTLVKMNYNSDMQAYLESSSRYDDYLTFTFPENATNINMTNVYFLTTSGTASACELVMIGLAPYMNVIQIGESTYGKYTGAWVLPDDNEEWCMVPIVMKYSNIEGYTDFVDGLTPDYEIDDYPWLGYQFGDVNDPMLAKAIELISGTVTIASTKSALISPFKKAALATPKDLKQNLFVPVDQSLPALK